MNNACRYASLQISVKYQVPVCKSLKRQVLPALFGPSTQSHKQIGPRLCMTEYMIAGIDVCVCVWVWVCVRVSE